MMDGRKLLDRVNFGLGRSARYIGQWADAFRPAGAFTPLDKQNRYVRLPATFLPVSGSDTRVNTYGEPLWQGIFDASYTQEGDYIVLGSRVFFIASQDPLLPVLCVNANRTISLARPNTQVNTAANPYGGYTSSGNSILMANWPASVLAENKTGVSSGGLPINVGVPYWNILIPSVFGIILSPGDLVTDDLGRTAVVTGSELTKLGWRINAKLATT
jgi:hypothetical protein